MAKPRQESGTVRRMYLHPLPVLSSILCLTRIIGMCYTILYYCTLNCVLLQYSIPGALNEVVYLTRTTSYIVHTHTYIHAYIHTYILK